MPLQVSFMVYFLRQYFFFLPPHPEKKKSRKKNIHIKEKCQHYGTLPFGVTQPKIILNIHSVKKI